MSNSVEKNSKQSIANMIPLMKNTFLKEFETKRALADFILESDKLSMGSRCKNFEKEFSEFQECEYAVLFNSGGSSNLAMLQALKNLGKIKDGARVGFSSVTWSTNVMPIIQLGLEPVPIDCDITTLNISSERLKHTLGEINLDALFLTNVLGFVGDLVEIRSICSEQKILLVEDNCEALGTITNGEKSGNFGICSSFSFFVAHHMSTIEGGMVCTNDEELDEMLKMVRSNGWDRNLAVHQQKKWRKKADVTSEFFSKYSFYDLGFNFRPTEITGFLGSYQLKHLEDNLEQRQENYLTFESEVIKNSDLIMLKRDQIDFLSSFALPIVCKTRDYRDKYVAQFAGAGVEIRPMIAGNIQEQFFFKKYVRRKADLAGAEFLHHNSFYCGNYPELTTDDMEMIKSCIIS